MKMTKVDALTAALSTLTADSYEVKHDAVFADGTPTTYTATYTQQDVREVIENMIAQLSKPRKVSDAAKANANAKRKDATAKARTALVEQVAPVLREVLTHTQQGMTAKEIFSDAASRLPTDFSAPKVQNILLRELRPELEVIEAKGKPNLYRLIER